MSTLIVCQVQWIDCKGEPTPDLNPAIGYAVLKSDGRKFAVCAAHAALMTSAQAHHQEGCRHRSIDPMSAYWSFEALVVQEVA